MIIHFFLERETKGAVRYQEVTEGGRVKEINNPDDQLVIGTLYVRKSALNGKIPVKLEIEVKF